MAVLGFSDDAQDIVSFRKAIFRMILSPAKPHLADPSDIDELSVSQAVQGISFELLAADTLPPRRSPNPQPIIS